MIHITTDNAVQVVPPKNGEDYSLEELQGFVGGYIEIVRLAEGQLMVVNEEGKLLGLPLNRIATVIYQDCGHNDAILGNALVCPDGAIE